MDYGPGAMQLARESPKPQLGSTRSRSTETRSCVQMISQWSLILAIVLCMGATSAMELESKNGTHSFCNNGVAFDVVYDVYGVPDSNIYDLDSLDSIKSVTCDFDDTALRLQFHNPLEAAKYYAIFKVENNFLTGGAKHGCPVNKDPSLDILMRRVISASYATVTDGVNSEIQVLDIKTAPARYDDIYEDADITMTSSRNSDRCDVDKNVCVGVNTDPTCAAAASSIPIFSNQFIDFECSDCFVALEADIFFTASIHHWKLRSLAAGFKNAQINADLTLDLKATAQWSTGVDKVVPTVTHANIVAFNVGPVPFAIWFEAPVEVKADASFFAQAEAIGGVSGTIDIGDSFISWDATNHWQHTKVSPKATFTPKVSGSASFDATADFSVTPTVTMHANNFFSYGMTLEPVINMEIKGDAASKQICETATYDVTATSLAELKIDIDFLHIHDDKKWGPTQVWTTGVQNISTACTPVA